MTIAIEEAPESRQVAMLYINCRVNGHPLKAFVDPGMMTIMNQVCAEMQHHTAGGSAVGWVAKGVARSEFSAEST